MDKTGDELLSDHFTLENEDQPAELSLPPIIFKFEEEKLDSTRSLNRSKESARFKPNFMKTKSLTVTTDEAVRYNFLDYCNGDSSMKLLKKMGYKIPLETLY